MLVLVRCCSKYAQPLNTKIECEMSEDFQDYMISFLRIPSAYAANTAAIDVKIRFEPEAKSRLVTYDGL